MDAKADARPHVERMSDWASRWTGSSAAICCALLLVAVWLALGPSTRFSESWLLLMNTFTSIATFLMVFLIQRAQNKESLAVQVKLNELIISKRGARNLLVEAESLSETELKTLREHFSSFITEQDRLAHPQGIRTPPPAEDLADE